MELSDEITITAPKAVVYDALNDPGILRRCIPGCEELIQHSPTEFEAKVVLKIGPVKARFSGTVTLDTAGAPDAFSLMGEGKGGTRLAYSAKAEVGGKIAQLGSRLIRGTATKLSAKFFTVFAEGLAETAVE